MSTQGSLRRTTTLGGFGRLQRLRRFWLLVYISTQGELKRSSCLVACLATSSDTSFLDLLPPLLPETPKTHLASKRHQRPETTPVVRRP